MEPVPETAENRVGERKRPMQCQDSLKKVLPFEEVVVGKEKKILGFEEVVPGVVKRTENLRNCSLARVSPRIRGSGSRQGSTTTTTYTNNLHQQQLLRRRYQLKS